ncbi:hypothetical protein RND81_07G025600 [Saponaria officinalis]|uniref:Helitron helicase-like domain-containing protein n=1 Tax=Saponaria officinalis TaxID=3572 RepID=A0AAW1JN09_SAPOF
MWKKGRIRKTNPPKFTLCYNNGTVELPKLKNPPPLLRQLLHQHPQSKHFVENIRGYNMMFSFTSMGGKIDRSINQGRGPYTFKIGGQNVHLIGSLLPMDENPPKFAQLYIYDTNEEVRNRKTYVGSSNQQQFLDDLIRSLKEMIYQHNLLAATFRMTRDRIALDNSGDVKMRLINHRDTDRRTYNLPTASEVAALVVGDIGITLEKRDIIIEKQCGTLNRISELHPSYLALQYPLLFPYSEDGFRLGITYSETSLRASTSANPRYKLTMREWFAYQIQDQPSTIEAPTLLLAGRLFTVLCRWLYYN